jgi:DNA processing protein
MPARLSPELCDLLALSLVPGLGPRLTAALLRHFGSAGAVRRAAAQQLRQVPQIGAKLSEDFAAALAAVDVDAEIALLERHDTTVVALGDPAYPAALAQAPAPPPLLYVSGTLTVADARAIAVVGSRGCTTYGRRVTERLAAGLARAGYTIVSGLARGIDGVAHVAALQAGGRTIAVLAGGLSRVYPPEHADLAADVKTAGALLSEAPMATEPLAALFPPRNRIISGLSMGVIVVEASERSGTLITARHAAEQGREVFAVPGPVDSATSAGCLRLIRDGATLIRGVDDVLEALSGSTTTSVGQAVRDTKDSQAQPDLQAPPAPPPELDGVGRRVWDFLADAARHVDTMSQELGVAVPELSRTLMLLEMKKLIRRLPGNQYERR